MEKIPFEKLPSLLREIPDCPKSLYIEGVLPDENEYKYIAIVGSRKYSSYGKEVCEKLIAGLSGFPIVIVSGLALGIDALAHEAALRAGLKTIAVPGSGLSDTVLYPAQHRPLAKKILKAGGALLSEFEPDFRATPYSFPQRNRVMAGISDAVLVVEAEMKSGTLITARLALEYNREVMTVPGSIFSKTSEGPHYLIRNGATPVSSSKDILDALGLASDERSAADAEFENCSLEEKMILEVLLEPKPRDELVQETGLSPQTLNSVISMLEIKGLIAETGGEIRRN